MSLIDGIAGGLGRLIQHLGLFPHAISRRL